MHYIPGLLQAVVPAMLAFYLVLAGIHLTVRAMSKSPGRFPVLAKLSQKRKMSHTDPDFEQFVVDRFDPGHFRLVRRQQESRATGTAFTEGPSSVLEYQALVHQQIIPFGVECLWRPRFTGGALDFADSNFFPEWRRFSEERKMPVFVIIGIGGTGSEPHDCYIVPTDVIQPDFTSLSKKFLDHYRRRQADAILFLDINQMILR